MREVRNERWKFQMSMKLANIEVSSGWEMMGWFCSRASTKGVRNNFNDHLIKHMKAGGRGDLLRI